ncbi:NAD(P)-binding domain-containing protein [Flavobacterium sp. SH_e]|uniref:NAD(P)-binding domain-containing protein n=1 Tax=Flavobacterium TaxID=237 RepID=UPI0021E5016C|nr:NAD(P)-binding domain-containing protein [Flavobacterium sp. SH_e]MCV2484794.1 NAD(P)-binding domain-containing protein [Flavobacterium sp. SH_e]
MKIGVIGISSLTLELACRASEAGYEVIINNPRGGSLIKEAVKKIEPNARIGTLEEAASAEIVLLFLAKDDLENVIQSLPDMTGKIVVHTSGLIFDPHLLLSGITNAMTYKITASLLPQAHVVNCSIQSNLSQNRPLL